MVGGRPDAVKRVEPFLRVLAPAADRGWLHRPDGALQLPPLFAVAN